MVSGLHKKKALWQSGWMVDNPECYPEKTLVLYRMRASSKRPQRERLRSKGVVGNGELFYVRRAWGTTGEQLEETAW